MWPQVKPSSVAFRYRPEFPHVYTCSAWNNIWPPICHRSGAAFQGRSHQPPKAGTQAVWENRGAQPRVARLCANVWRNTDSSSGVGTSRNGGPTVFSRSDKAASAGTRRLVSGRWRHGQVALADVRCGRGWTSMAVWARDEKPMALEGRIVECDVRGAKGRACALAREIGWPGYAYGIAQ